MDEIVPGLWIGNLPSALDTETLQRNGIFSVLSAMRGRVTIHETFIKHQIQLDDTADEDILIHFLPCITFIQAELDRKRGVLVHCQAGMSRSASIVAAYLMYSKKMTVDQALETIRRVRPDTQPNDGFMMQLEVFHQSSFKISRSNKPTRMYYLARTVEEVMNGDGTLPSSSKMFAKFPNTPNSDSGPSTPGPIVRRRIRCKMCRQELATREHMLDHGQLNPPTPANQSPAPSRRPSATISPDDPTRAAFTSTNMVPPSPLGHSQTTSTSTSTSGSGTSASRPRRPSNLGVAGVGESLAMSSIPISDGVGGMVRSLSGGTTVAIEPYDDGDDVGGAGAGAEKKRGDSAVESDEEEEWEGGMDVGRAYEVDAAKLLGSRMSSVLRGSGAADGDEKADSVISRKDLEEDEAGAGATDYSPTQGLSSLNISGEGEFNRDQRPKLPELASTPVAGDSTLAGKTTTLSRAPSVSSPAPASAPSNPTGSILGRSRVVGSPAPIPYSQLQPHAPTLSGGLRSSSGSGSGYMTPQDLTAQLFTNPKLAALRAGSGGVSPGGAGAGGSGIGGGTGGGSGSGGGGSGIGGGGVSLPIIANSKCSGYFLEPMKWMEPILSSGQLAGKIMCPNTKCNAKLGNFDWAGVRCSCKEWVTPGFCLARSKVDEVV